MLVPATNTVVMCVVLYLLHCTFWMLKGATGDCAQVGVSAAVSVAIFRHSFEAVVSHCVSDVCPARDRFVVVALLL